MDGSYAAVAKRVLIVGGGPGGQKVAQQLQKLNKGQGSPWQITLVFSNPFVEMAPASCYYTAHHEEFHRFVGPQNVKDVANKKWASDLAGIEVRVGQAIIVEEGKVKIKTAAAGEEWLPYDLLGVATGSNFGPVLSPKPLQSLLDRAAEVKLISTTLARAKKCVIVGGGPIAVKVAGDYKEANPQCEVIIACRSQLRIKNWDDAEHAKLRDLVSSLGIVVLENLGEIVEPQLPVDVAACCAGAKRVKFANNSAAELGDVDLLVPGFATGLNTDFMPKEYLTNGGMGAPIATNQYGQSLKDPHVFGIGAVASRETDFPGVPRYDDGAKMWALNMAAALQGEPLSKDLTQRTTFKNAKAPFNLVVGHTTGGVLAPRHAPMGEGGLFKCCGFPCLLCCPCFCACPFTCGYCCEALPAGRGRGFGKVMLKMGATYSEGPLPGAPAQQAMA